MSFEKNILKYNEFYNQIKEGLIKTYPIKTALKLISRDLSLRGINYNIDTEFETNTIFVKILSSDINIDNVLNIFRTINLCGYFISNYDFYDSKDNNIDYLIHNDKLNDDFIKALLSKINNSKFTQLTIESKYNKLVNIPKYLYHVTSKDNKGKILKIGLVPKSKNKRANHNDRIYLGYNKIVTKNLAYQFSSGDYILLEIDTKGLNIKLYDDPDFTENGVYTYDNIPNSNIEIIEEFSI
jgi:hypothetical protein